MNLEEVVMVCFNVLSCHSPRETEEDCGKVTKVAGAWPRFQAGIDQNKVKKNASLTYGILGEWILMTSYINNFH
jgi:hypothetical protein